jgi:hypothetical protein
VNSDQWSRVKHHFNDALELAPHARDAWAARLAAEAPEVRAEVEALIRSHADVSAFLEEPIVLDPQELADALDAQAPFDQTATSLAPGTRIGDYEIRREIGRGGMGVVYLAHDVHLARPVALKALPTQIAGDRRLVERLHREAQAAAAVSHPGIATVYAFLETSEGNFIASEFIQGRTLRQELQQAAIEPARATRLAAEIARALSAAHDARVVHRDLKPENILFTASGAIKIIDFGIARLERADLPALTIPGLVHGTPGYMAPELLVGGATVDGRADLYALGVILAEMVCGHHPLEREPEGVPAVLAPIIRRCLESDPSRRYRFTRDLLRDLERASLALEMSEPTVLVPRPVRGAMFWWQFHQGLTALVYWVVAIPAWFARGMIGGRAGRALFFVTLGALLFASILRLHLWFTSRLSREELPMQVKRERPWILIADLVLSAALIVSGVLLSETRIGFAVLLLAVGIGSAVIALFIEPATARAALSDIPDSPLGTGRG